MMVIGLTGGIASGKSTVSRMLSNLGAVVIDADKVGHEAFLRGTDAWHKVVAAFGNGILDQNNEIDRSKLSDIVFSGEEELEKLNEIMHPTMHRIVEQRIEDLKSQGIDVVVLEAALLIEANWTDLVDQVWVTTSTQDAVIGRLRSQKGFTGEQARARISSQMSPDEKLKYADVVIENDSDLEALREKVENIWRRFRSSHNT
jgi:dephospho-CoA kinase